MQARGAIEGQQIGGCWYFSTDGIERLRLRRRTVKGGLPRAQPVSELAGLDPVFIRRGLALLAKGAAPIELAIQLGMQAQHVRALISEFQILRTLTTQSNCQRCEEQAAALCYECAAAVGAAPAPAASGPIP